MRKTALLIATILGLGLSAMADEVSPASGGGIQIEPQAYNYIQVQVASPDQAPAQVQVFDSQQELVGAHRLGTVAARRYDLSTLAPGRYTVRIVLHGQVLSSRAIEL